MNGRWFNVSWWFLEDTLVYWGTFQKYDGFMVTFSSNPLCQNLRSNLIVWQMGWGVKTDIWEVNLSMAYLRGPKSWKGNVTIFVIDALPDSGTVLIKCSILEKIRHLTLTTVVQKFNLPTTICTLLVVFCVNLIQQAKTVQHLKSYNNYNSN